MINLINKIRTKTGLQILNLFFLHGIKLYRTASYHMSFIRLRNKRIKGLNLGAGNSRILGFINIDASWMSSSDVVADVKKIKLNDNSVGILFSSHVFEHFGREEANYVLKEWFRVIEPEGFIYICVPNIEVLFKIYVENVETYEKNKKLVDDSCSIVYGGQTNKYDYHYSGYSFDTLKYLLERTGFIDVQLFEPSRVDFVNQLGTQAFLARLGDKEISLNIRAKKPADK